MAKLDTISGLHYEMMKRCYNKNSVMYKDYGAKGIIVCEEWHNIENFKKWCIDNGYKKGMRVERIDPSIGYFPYNCKLGMNHTTKKYNTMMRERAKNNKVKKSKIHLRRITDSQLYGVYTSMHTRCENKNHLKYDIYGGRGISVCNEWCGRDGIYNFIEWSLKNGWKKGYTLDRIDNDRGYSPDNCRWVTWKEQGRNKRNSIYGEYKGQTIHICELSEITGISYGLIYYRVKKHGMSFEEAVKYLEEKRMKKS